MQPADAVFNAEGREGLNRASVEGLQVALSEMFLLSRTHHLIMTRSSSFGGTSGALGRSVVMDVRTQFPGPFGTVRTLLPQLYLLRKQNAYESFKTAAQYLASQVLHVPSCGYTIDCRYD